MLATVHRASQLFQHKKAPHEKATKIGRQWVMEFNTLEDVLELVRNENIILAYDKSNDPPFDLTFYDYYVE